MMKKTICALLALVMVLSLAACGEKKQEEQQEPKTLIDEIQERGYLTLVTEPYFAPMEFIDPAKEGDAKYVGMDIEIGQYIAEQLGVELKIVPLEFGAVLSSIAEGKYDIALSGLGYTPERAEAFAFTTYYLNEGDNRFSLVVREEDYDLYNSFEDFNGKKVVAQAGSLQETYALNQMDTSKFGEFIRVSSTTDGYMMVQEGKADAAVCAVANADLYIEANPGMKTLGDKMVFEVDPETLGTRGGVAKGNPEFLAFVNKCLEELRDSGKASEWYQQYKEYAAKLGL